MCKDIYFYIDIIIKAKYMINIYIIDILKQVFKSKNIKSQLEKTYLSLQYHSNNDLSNKEGDFLVLTPEAT